MLKNINYFSLKRNITFVVITLGAIFLAITLIIIRDTTSFTFLSRASEEQTDRMTTIKNRKAENLTRLIDDQRPQCVSDFEYFSEDDEKICFIQFACKNNIQEVEINDKYFTCNVNSQSMNWCTYNDPVGACITLSEWIQLSSRICGC